MFHSILSTLLHATSIKEYIIDCFSEVNKISLLSETCEGMMLLQYLIVLILGAAIDGSGEPYTLINRVQTECELEALSYGTKLTDSYNYYDEDTEWDMRIHNDYITEHLGFAGWIQSGTWKSGGITAEKNSAKKLQEVSPSLLPLCLL